MRFSVASEFATVQHMSSAPQLLPLAALPAFTESVLAALAPQSKAAVLALTGDLGAGKTTFVKQLAATLGVTETVTSPTFTVFKVYETTHPTWTTLVHMDAYRIENVQELGPLRFTELLATPNTLFCIEWADQIKAALPKEATWLHFAATEDESVRSVQFQ